MFKFVKPITPAIGTNPKPKSPFFVKMLEGANEDLSNNYSGGAADAAFTASAASMVICEHTLFIGQTTPTTNTTAEGGFAATATALTNGLKYAVKDGSNNVVQDITVTYPLKTDGDLITFFTDVTTILGLWSTTSASNFYQVGFVLDFRRAFGAPLFLPKGYKFVCTLNDDLSAASLYIRMGISGYFE